MSLAAVRILARGGGARQHVRLAVAVPDRRSQQVPPRRSLAGGGGGTLHFDSRKRRGGGGGSNKPVQPDAAARAPPLAVAPARDGTLVLFENDRSLSFRLMTAFAGSNCVFWSGLAYLEFAGIGSDPTLLGSSAFFAWAGIGLTMASGALGMCVVYPSKYVSRVALAKDGAVHVDAHDAFGRKRPVADGPFALAALDPQEVDKKDPVAVARAAENWRFLLPGHRLRMVVDTSHGTVHDGPLLGAVVGREDGSWLGGAGRARAVAAAVKAVDAALAPKAPEPPAAAAVAAAAVQATAKRTARGSATSVNPAARLKRARQEAAKAARAGGGGGGGGGRGGGRKSKKRP